MKNFKNIEQGSDEWHAIRYGKIGGTLASGLMVDSDTLFIDIASQIAENMQIEDNYVSAEMQRGIDLEPMARSLAGDLLDIDFRQSGWLQCEDNELLGISPDGLTLDEKKAIEVKCLGRKKHFEVSVSKQIPREHINQCIHYFTVNPKLEVLYFVCYRPENKNNPIVIITLLRLDGVDLGTKSKPNVKSIQEWSELMREEANILLTKIKVL